MEGQTWATPYAHVGKLILVAKALGNMREYWMRCSDARKYETDFDKT